MRKSLDAYKVICELEKYIDELLLKKGINLNLRAKFLSSIRSPLTRLNPTQPGSLELYCRRTISMHKKFLEKIGWPKKEIDEFCKEIELKYRQLRTEITPSYIT
jgi:hypothetical protein